MSSSSNNNNNEGHFGGPPGKGNPPKNGQFKKGQSGNPKGRPKKPKSTFEDDVEDILNAKTKVRIGDDYKEISMRRLILQQIINEAAKMNPKALKYAVPMLKLGDVTPEFEVLPEDESALEDLIKTMGYKDE